MRPGADPAPGALRRLKAPVAFTLESPPPRPPTLAAEVDAIWAAERAKRPHLFDGTIYSVADIRGAAIHIQRRRYAELLAQRRAPALASALAVRPLAVTGATLLGQGVVLGRRAAAAASEPGCWELVPAGAVDHLAAADGDRFDPARSLLNELDEELGLSAADLQGPPALVALFDDRAEPLVELCYVLRASLPAEDLLSRLAARETPEHAAFDVVGLDALPAWLDAAPAVTSVTRVLCSALAAGDL